MSAHAGGTNLRATVLELQSGRPAQPLGVKLEYDAGLQGFQRVGEGEYALNLPAATKRLAVIAETPDQLVPRRGTGITLDRLRQDAASAWSLHGDRLQAENVSAVVEAYERSKAHLLSVQTKTDRIARELAIVTGKIATFANP